MGPRTTAILAAGLLLAACGPGGREATQGAATHRAGAAAEAPSPKARTVSLAVGGMT